MKRMINLRKLKNKDVDGMLEWMHDSNINRYFRFPCENTSKEDALEFIKKASLQFDKNISRHYAVVDCEDQYLGTISLKEIDNISSSAEYAISLRALAQNKGIGTEATKKLLKIAFEELKLHRVYLNVLSDNESAIKLYKKCGFIYEGESRDAILIRGKYKSLKWFSMLYDDYKEGESAYENNAK